MYITQQEQEEMQSALDKIKDYIAKASPIIVKRVSIKLGECKSGDKVWLDVQASRRGGPTKYVVTDAETITRVQLCHVYTGVTLWLTKEKYVIKLEKEKTDE